MRATRTAAITAAVALGALLLAPTTGFANDSAMGGAGGAVTPIGSSSIRMAAETVQVIVYQQFAEYRVDFRFDNAGASQKVKLGFPFPVPVEGAYTPPAAFRAWQGDTPLAVTYQETADEDGLKTGYYLHEADFPTGETMIRVSYFAYHDSWAATPPQGAKPPARFSGADSFWGSYPYQVSTGAGWAGTIGTSVIRYCVSPDALAWGIDEAIEEQARLWAENTEAPKDAAKVLRQYTKPAPSVYEWTFTDFEPTPYNGRSAYDVELPFFIPYGASEFAEPWMAVADVKASSELKLGEFEYLAHNAVDGNPSTAWAESAKGSGTGQALTVTFPAKRHVAEVRVLPGYAKTEELFRKYNRPKVLDVEFSDGTKTTLDLTGEPSLQRFDVNVDAEWAKVTIGDVYRGTTRDETYLSEIEFSEAPAPKMLPFTTVLAGGLTEPSIQATGQPQPDGKGEDRNPTALPEWLHDPGWPLFAGCVGCGILLGVVIGGVIVLVARRRGAFRKQSPEAEVPPAGPPPPL